MCLLGNLVGMPNADGLSGWRSACCYSSLLSVTACLLFTRTAIQPGTSHPDIQLLHPINLEFFVSRNLAANWYHKVPVVEIKGRLDSMNVSTCMKITLLLMCQPWKLSHMHKERADYFLHSERNILVKLCPTNPVEFNLQLRIINF